jgi:coenzyme F420-reducing hydrogenase gamma subunit
MRNPIGVQPLLERAYVENVTLHPGIPLDVVPALLPMARPVHRVDDVDVFLPGCPPSADLFYQALVLFNTSSTSWSVPGPMVSSHAVEAASVRIRNGTM